ncbi:hypothetical protein ACFUP3_03035 [Bacillus paralicheniformis]|uniref:hypothetical protein n=1 Tax=Bacillus paralicheniformis TaxID=1648923 RepID=UPI0036279D43
MKSYPLSNSQFNVIWKLFLYCFDVTGSPSNADLDGKIQHLSEMIDQKVESIERAITSGMAPNFEEFPSDFPNFVKRKIEGESYSKLASELDISSGKIFSR